jgi:hypothetical protein
MTRIAILSGLVVLGLLGGCNKKDKEVLTGKASTLDTFEFKPKTAQEMSAAKPAASAPKSALDGFVFKPRTAAEMSAPKPKSASDPPSALDNFVFVPRSAAEMASGSKAK